MIRNIKMGYLEPVFKGFGAMLVLEKSLKFSNSVWG
jgi:hypothetical protein